MVLFWFCHFFISIPTGASCGRIYQLLTHWYEGQGQCQGRSQEVRAVALTRQSME